MRCFYFIFFLFVFFLRQQNENNTYTERKQKIFGKIWWMRGGGYLFNLSLLRKCHFYVYINIIFTMSSIWIWHRFRREMELSEVDKIVQRAGIALSYNWLLIPWHCVKRKPSWMIGRRVNKVGNDFKMFTPRTSRPPNAIQIVSSTIHKCLGMLFVPFSRNFNLFKEGRRESWNEWIEGKKRSEVGRVFGVEEASGNWGGGGGSAEEC